MVPPVKRIAHWLAAGLAGLVPAVAPAWEPNQLLVWINGDKGYEGIAEIGRMFEERTGIPVAVEHP